MQNPVKLVFIDPEPPGAVGGGIRTYIGLAAALCQSRGFEVRVYSHNPGRYPGMETLPIGRTPCLPRGIRALAYRFFYGEAVAYEQARWLAGELRCIPFDCAEFADFQGYAYYALRDPALRTKTALRIHTPLYLVYAETGRGKGLAFQFLRRRERACLERALHTTAPSGEFAQEKLPWVKNIRVIPNPPPAPSANPSPSPGGFHILFLGRIEPRKGPLILLRAFLSLAGQFPQASLTFVGDMADSVYAAKLRKAVEQAPESSRLRIRFLPAHGGDKAELLRNFSCLVVPSSWENSPYVFWEGICAGIPCLGTESGEMKRARQLTGAPEIPPGDADAMATALRRLLTSPESCRDLAARQKDYLQQVAETASALPDFYQQCARTNP